MQSCAHRKTTRRKTIRVPEATPASRNYILAPNTNTAAWAQYGQCGLSCRACNAIQILSGTNHQSRFMWLRAARAQPLVADCLLDLKPGGPGSRVETLVAQ